jgi:hypothetical protein
MSSGRISFLTIHSNTILNNKTDSPSPCRNPTPIGKLSDVAPPQRTLALAPLNVSWIILISFGGHPFHIALCLMLS